MRRHAYIARYPAFESGNLMGDTFANYFEMVISDDCEQL